ncbi:MAG: hypothetical protein SV775_10270 [Thermodesulfobacteriota bacterium]|nr:hypothetical protein [Thermodesulfobacteriota bacterium]
MTSNKVMIFVAVFCAAFSTLALELVQTRVLSALFYNHVVYLTVTIALMGFGISGVLVSIVSRKLKSPDKWAAACIGGFAISSFLCLRAVSFAPVIFPGTHFLIKLVFCYAVLVIPFLCSGTALGLIFMAHGKDIYRLYFTDLAASALGAFGFSFLLRPLGGDALVWMISGVAFIGFLVYGHSSGLSKLFPVIALPIALFGLFRWGNDLVNDQPESYKVSAQIYLDHRKDVKIEKSEWTTIAKIDVLSDPVYSLLNWEKDPWAPNFKMITQDGDAFTVMPGPKWTEEIYSESRPDNAVSAQNLGYLIKRNPEEALIIGTGGGFDIVSAKAFGAKHITGVEINPATHDLVHGPYRDYLAWPTWENVSAYCAEGRHFVASTDKKFDTIVMSGIDTFSALNTGAYVLSENYLYTVEAIEDYMNALKPDGIMTIFRCLFHHPRESLRLANLFLTAAERQSIDDASLCIIVVAMDFRWPFRFASTIFKKQPFTPEEVRTILERCKRRQEISVVYIPNVFPPDVQERVEADAFSHDTVYMEPARKAFASLLCAGSKEERNMFIDEYRHNITPVYDDRPFFFEYHKISEILSGAEENVGARGTFVHYVLYFLFFATAAAAFLSMIVPLYVFAREGLKVKGLWPLLGFFSSLGMGFMFLELGLIQRLNIYLGHPMHSLAVVLAGLLFFTGVGSYRAGTVQYDIRKLLKKGMIGVAISAVLWLAVMSVVIPLTLGWPLWVRILITLLSILPVGLCLGVPFATGLRYLEERYPRFIPWAWGINGITSVMGSILAILLAMRIGFKIVIFLGCITYIFGLLTMLFHLRSGWKVD